MPKTEQLGSSPGGVTAALARAPFWPTILSMEEPQC